MFLTDFEAGFVGEWHLMHLRSVFKQGSQYCWSHSPFSHMNCLVGLTMWEKSPFGQSISSEKPGCPDSNLFEGKKE